MFGRPFDSNAVYEYHKFWANPTRDALQDYLDFSNRWNVPVMIGETGEYTNSLEREIPQAQRALQYRLVLLDLQESRHQYVGGLDPEAGRMGSGR